MRGRDCILIFSVDRNEWSVMTHGGMFSYRVQWLIKCWINDTVNRKFNCLGAMIFQSCKPVIVASIFKFLLTLQLLLARPVSIKWILLATRNFHSHLVSWRAVVSHTAVTISYHHLTWIWYQKNYILVSDHIQQVQHKNQFIFNTNSLSDFFFYVYENVSNLYQLY